LSARGSTAIIGIPVTIIPITVGLARIELGI
jgi:hypothetical protein